MRFAKNIWTGIFGCIVLFFLLCVMLIIMIERAEKGMAADEAAGMAEHFQQADFPAGTVK